MDTVPKAFEIQALLEESEWVGGLALSLVGDNHHAEDLSQDVWLAAMRRPPHGGESPRPWIVAVARNGARFFQRSENARKSREQAKAREHALEVGASAEELATRLECQEMISKLVRELPEEFSDVIMLSFFEGLSSKSIACLRRLPEGTVRWRKKRALELLKERLDRHHGGERLLWMSALAPVAALWSWRGTQSASTLYPWITMAITWKSISLTVAAALVAAIFSWGFGDLTGMAFDAQESKGSVKALQVEVPIAQAPQLDAKDSFNRTPVEVAPSQVKPPALSIKTRVRLRVVDTRGVAVAGVEVRAVPSLSLTDAIETELAGLSSDAVNLLMASLVQTSSSSGEVFWETEFLHEAGMIGFEASGPYSGSAPLSVLVEPGGNLDLGQLVLVSRGSVDGTVRMLGGEDTGKRFIELGPAKLPKSAAALARLREFGLENAKYMELSAQDGTFEFEGVIAGEYRAFVSPNGFGPPGWSEPFVVVSGQRSGDVEIVLDGNTVTHFEVLVLGPDGEPVPAAEVVLKHGLTHYSSKANAKGLWVYFGTLDGSLAESLEVSDTSLQLRRETLASVAMKPGRIVIRLQLAATVEHNLTIVDSAGAAIANARVGVLSAVGERVVNDFQSGSTLRLPAASEGRFDLSIKASGYRHRLIEGLSGSRLDEPWQVVLESLPGIQGQVLSGGKPLRRAKVFLNRKIAEGRVLEKGSSVSQLGMRLAKVRTDSEGRFTIHAEEDGDLVLGVEARGYAGASIELSGFLANEGRRDVLVELDHGGEVVGIVRDHTGLVIPNASVVLNHPQLGFLQKTAKRDGSFRFQRVPAGDWYLRVVPDTDLGSMAFSVEVPDGWSYPDNCQVVAGEKSVHDLVLADRESARISGRLSTTGLDPGTLALEVYDDSSNLFSGDPFVDSFEEEITLDSSGAFDILLPEGRSYNLAISSIELGARLRRSVEPDELPFVVDSQLGFASLRVQVTEWLERGSGSDWIGVKWSANGWSYFEGLSADEEGRIAPLILPAGRITLEWRPVAGAELMERVFEVEPGEDRVINLE